MFCSTKLLLPLWERCSDSPNQFKWTSSEIFRRGWRQWTWKARSYNCTVFPLNLISCETESGFFLEIMLFYLIWFGASFCAISLCYFKGIITFTPFSKKCSRCFAIFIFVQFFLFLESSNAGLYRRNCIKFLGLLWISAASLMHFFVNSVFPFYFPYSYL